ncbi:uncharacterized protein ARMOST_16026 [Armillaria ostoyae]|uniref:Zinc-finger domain-containing protein n=1 Tax=Armillaria ostoyae TaxID=47428 RepID=A0A284RV06_ARMOS|nr:uncharacterized protein ARMOST_16026 [Armillaria ostoyae]
MTGSSLLNWDGSLTAQKRPDADHSSTNGPNNTNAALRYGSVSRFPTPYNGVNGTFDAINGVLQTVSVQSKKYIHDASHSSRNPLTASSSPSSSHSPGCSTTARIDTSTYNSQVTTQTIDPNVRCGLLGVDNSKDNEEELMRLVEQTMPLSCETADTADRVEFNSVSRPSEEPNDAPIQMPEVSSAQSLFSTSPVSPSSSHISPLFTPPPPPKRRRMFMSHVAVPPLPGHKGDYRTMMLSRHGLLDRKAKVKAAGLIEVFGGLRAAYQEEEAMIEGESFSSSLRPSTTKFQRSRSYSSDDEIPLMIQRNSSRRAEPSSSPRKRRKPSVEITSSPPPRKRSKKDEVHARARQHTQSPAAMAEGGRASVIRDSLPKNLTVKSNPSKQRKQSVGPRTPSVQAHTKPVVSRTKSIAASFCSDEEPAMTFSVYYDDTLEHVRLIDAREGIYEYTMQDEDPVSEEVLSMNLQFIRSQLKGHRVTEDMQWYDPEVDVDVEPTETPPVPLAMSAKARGKQKAAPVSPAKDIFLPPKYHIATNLGSDFEYLEGDHSVFHDPHVPQPRVGPIMHFPHVHHFPVHDSDSLLCSSSSQGREQLLGPLHDFSSLVDKAYLHDSNLDLSHLWLETSESLHNGTIDPSLLGGFESMDQSSLSSSSSSSGSSLRDKSPSLSPPPKVHSPAVQIETEIHPPSRLLSPQCPTVAGYQPQLNNVLDELELSDLTSLDDSSPCINPISLDPPPALSPKPTTIPVKVGPPARRKRPQWPMAEESSFCHQCRTRSFRVSVQCGCRMIYCVRCITTKYDNLEFDADAKDFVCPKCSNTCTCDVCTRRRGEEYVSTKKQGGRALVSSSRSPRKSGKSRKARDAEEMDTEDQNPAPLYRLGPALHHHHLHVPLRKLPHVSPLGGRTNIPPLSERKQGPVKYWGTIYSFTGEKIATAYIPEDGSSNTLLVQRSRVFVGEIQPVWGLGTNPTLRVVDPVKKMVENDAQMTRRRFVGQRAPLFMPIRTIDSSGVMEYGSDADGEHDPEEPGDRLTPNDEHPGFEWRRGEDLDPDKISLADEDVTSVVIMSLKQIGITAMVSTE